MDDLMNSQSMALLALMTAHYLGDFPLQNLLPGNVALNKSHDWKALLLHTSTYSVLFFPWGWKFALVTFAVHTLTDAVTSRLTTRFWYMPVMAIQDTDIAWQRWPWMLEHQWTHFTRLDLKNRSLFWCLIGFDQWLHAAQLIVTFWLLT